MGWPSSPEAWVNVANELMGDEELREAFQVWQFYYPTNMPIALNHEAIRKTLGDAMRHFDPNDENRASRGMVIVGHSMGGIIARLMVSSSGDSLWDRLVAEKVHDEKRLERIRQRVAHMLRFDPLPQVDRVVFIAAPHRGTDLAGSGLGRWIGRMVRMPLATLKGSPTSCRISLPTPTAAAGARRSRRASTTSTSRTRSSGPRPTCRFRHACITTPSSASADRRCRWLHPTTASVPYWSSHLEGAASEKVVHAGHSVQETPQAVIELKRILHRDIRERVSDGTLQPCRWRIEEPDDVHPNPCSTTGVATFLPPMASSA